MIDSFVLCDFPDAFLQNSDTEGSFLPERVHDIATGLVNHLRGMARHRGNPVRFGARDCR